MRLVLFISPIQTKTETLETDGHISGPVYSEMAMGQPNPTKPMGGPNPWPSLCVLLAACVGVKAGTRLWDLDQ